MQPATLIRPPRPSPSGNGLMLPIQCLIEAIRRVGQSAQPTLWLNAVAGGPAVDKGGRPHSMATLIRRQENLALKLLDEALDPKVGVDVRLDVFDRVSRYLAVKNRITDAEETDIDRFKARIHGPQAEAPQSRGPRREAVAQPKDLAGIKSKLSGGGSSSPDGNSGNTGVEIPPTT